jgi:hypothetical protein
VRRRRSHISRTNNRNLLPHLFSFKINSKLSQ